MSGQKKSIDEIWKDLNRKPTLPKSSGSSVVYSLPNLRSATKQGGTSTNFTLGALLPKSNPVATATTSYSLSDVKLQSVAQNPVGTPIVNSSRSDELSLPGGTALPDPVTTFSTIQRTFNCLTDPDRSKRTAAAVALLSYLASSTESLQLQDLVSGPLLQPLLDLLSDTSEKCRNIAIQICTLVAKGIPDLAAILPRLLPVLVKRAGTLPVEEPAEEIRLQITGLLDIIIAKVSLSPSQPASTTANAAAEASQQASKNFLCTSTNRLSSGFNNVNVLEPFVPEFAALISRALEDPYHEIKKSGCTTLMSLCAAVDRRALRSHSERLLGSLNGNLIHQHYRVRLATIQAIGALVASGALEAGQLEAIVAPKLKPIAYDASQSVREALFRSIALWLGYEGQERDALSAVFFDVDEHVSDSAAAALLAVLLVGLSDAHEATSQLVLKLVEGVGAAWAVRHGVSRSSSAGKTSVELTASASGEKEQGSAVRSCVAMDVDADGEGGARAVSPGTDTGENMVRVLAALSGRLQHPFRTRPGAGARAMVSELLFLLLPPLAKELVEWTVTLRQCAARVLFAVLVFAESASVNHLPRLLPVLCTAIGDEDRSIANLILSAIHVLGTCVTPRRWLPLMLDHLSGAVKLSTGQRANALVVLSGLLHAAGQAQTPVPEDLLPAAAGVLNSEDMRTADHPAVRQQLSAVLENFIHWAGPSCSLVSGELYSLALFLYGHDPATSAALLTSPEANEAGADEVVITKQESLPGSSVPMVTEECDASASGATRTAPESSSNGPSTSSEVDSRSDALTSTSASSNGGGGSGGGSARLLSDLARVCGHGSFQAFSSRYAEDTLSAALRDADAWTQTSANCVAVGALLRTSGRATLERLYPRITAAFCAILADHERQPELRMALLQLLDQVFEDPTRGPAFGGANAEATLRLLLLPPLVWRAGKSAAAVRFAAVTAVGTFLRRGLCPAPAAAGPVQDGTMLPLLLQCLDEDWYTDVRLSSSYATALLLELLGARLGEEQRRTVYIDLLKRLDDSANAVRVAACGALRALVRGGGAGYCDTNSKYLAEGTAIHMDDCDPSVQEAAFSVLEAMARLKPRVVAEVISKARERFRSKHYCDRVLSLCGSA